jgi:hypothetical protein
MTRDELADKLERLMSDWFKLNVNGEHSQRAYGNLAGFAIDNFQEIIAALRSVPPSAAADEVEAVAKAIYVLRDEYDFEPDDQLPWGDGVGTIRDQARDMARAAIRALDAIRAKK